MLLKKFKAFMARWQVVTVSSTVVGTIFIYGNEIINSRFGNESKRGVEFHHTKSNVSKIVNNLLTLAKKIYSSLES